MATAAALADVMRRRRSRTEPSAASVTVRDLRRDVKALLAAIEERDRLAGDDPEIAGREANLAQLAADSYVADDSGLFEREAAEVERSKLARHAQYERADKAVDELRGRVEAAVDAKWGAVEAEQADIIAATKNLIASHERLLQLARQGLAAAEERLAEMKSEHETERRQLVWQHDHYDRFHDQRPTIRWWAREVVSGTSPAVHIAGVPKEIASEVEAEAQRLRNAERTRRGVALDVQLPDGSPAYSRWPSGLSET